jgi:hypothetical protein
MQLEVMHNIKSGVQIAHPFLYSIWAVHDFCSVKHALFDLMVGRLHCFGASILSQLS